MEVEPEAIRGGLGKLADRSGRCKNIDSVLKLVSLGVE